MEFPNEKLTAGEGVNPWSILSLHRRNCSEGQCGADDMCKRWRNWLVRELQRNQGGSR